MTDDELARAWESFAVALHDVPRQRENRRRAANLMRGASLAELGFNRGQSRLNDLNNNYTAALENNIYQAKAMQGIRPGIFGFGITL